MNYHDHEMKKRMYTSSELTLCVFHQVNELMSYGRASFIALMAAAAMHIVNVSFSSKVKNSMAATS